MTIMENPQNKKIEANGRTAFPYENLTFISKKNALYLPLIYS
jgi:hypothetical protein